MHLYNGWEAFKNEVSAYSVSDELIFRDNS